MHARDPGGGRVGGKAACKRRADPDSLPLVGDHQRGLGRERIVVAHEMREADRLPPRPYDEDVPAAADAGQECEIGRPQPELAEAPVP